MREPRARKQLAERYQAVRASFADLIARRFTREGTAPPLDPPQLATLLLAMDMGLALHGLADPAAVPQGLNATAMVRLLE